MSKERRLILKMLAEGKLSVDEAERLLSAIEGAPANEETADSRVAFVSRLVQELQKSLNEIGAQAGGELRKMKSRLQEPGRIVRLVLEEMRKNAQPEPQNPRKHTITVEVEEETATAAKDAEEASRHDNNG